MRGTSFARAPRRFVSAAVAGSLFAVAVATPHLAEAAPKSAHVSYLAGTTVYVDAGRDDGVSVGDTLRVLRARGVVATLQVTSVSGSGAACRSIDATTSVAVGDVVLFSSAFPNAPIDGSLIAPAETPSAAAPVPRRSSKVRGRVGARWLLVHTAEDAGVAATSDLAQPSLDVKLDATNLSGGRVDVNVDLRSRITTRTAGGVKETDSRSRVYRASVAWHDANGRRRLTMGRQSAAALSTISLFDGVLLESRGRRFTLGVFAGAEPEPVKLGLSSDLVEAGAFVAVDRTSGPTRRWSATFGAATSYEDGSPSRDFAFAQASVLLPRLVAFATQELDVNRAWKRALGDPGLSWTSTYASMRVPLTTWSTVNAGYDNRRNVRLYRDRSTPETDFDDRYRQGVWLGGSLEPARQVRFTTDVRTRSGGGRSRSTTWSGSVDVRRLTRWNGRTRVRVSRFSDDSRTSDLVSLAIGADPLAFAHAEISGGVRHTTEDSPLGAGDERETWIDVDLDATVRRWFLNWSTERTSTSFGTVWQQLAGASWRF
jgi:hypothetical protein